MPVRAERHPEHPALVTEYRSADGFAGVGVPQSQRVVPAGGDDALPVSTVSSPRAAR